VNRSYTSSSRQLVVLSGYLTFVRAWWTLYVYISRYNNNNNNNNQICKAPECQKTSVALMKCLLPQKLTVFIFGDRSGIMLCLTEDTDIDEIDMDMTVTVFYNETPCGKHQSHEERLSELIHAVLCTTLVPSCMCSQLNSFYSILGLGLMFYSVFLCV